MNVRKLAVQGGAGLGGTILLAGAMWLNAFQPKVEAGMLDPVRTGGDVGEEVVTPSFTLRVEGVVAARSLAPDSILDDAPAVGTDGVYVIVRARAMSREEPLQLRSAVLETPGGHEFDAAPRPGAGQPPPAEFQPLIWTDTAFVFELPKDRLAGAHLVVGTGGLLPQLSSAVDVDLGLTGARAADLVRKAPERYEMRVGT
ncbi:hypothetical protein [Actinomadura sp. WMMB 499]|uniref:hypothetical protein n=1 Tax=Actinomadura sp. WMMB 499 TaxID=1219491 RepID=UPI001247F5EC|nr:hypothetical protein [Actinomadura sp. WMMB 499]QFG22098.1 hypothetical protein F7P10_14150 [Actinomadura sp. WMMB 499]